MANRRFKFVYPARLVDEPILYQLVRQFDLVTNVRHAHVEEEGGLLELELRGDDATIQQALEWVRGLGIEVQEAETGVS